MSPSTIFYVEEASAGGGGEGPPLPPSVETLAADVITASKEAEGQRAKAKREKGFVQLDARLRVAWRHS